MSFELLGGLSPEEFLRKHWQKKPLFIEQAIPHFEMAFNGSELAGLSCEEGVHSRIVIEKGGEKPWQVSLGPFKSGVFKRLPKSHWTLLVQEVDHFVPEIEKIRESFRFIPDWRVDDVMVSYAVDGGGVGPHLDQYDVFLLQAKGQRRWTIETKKRMDDHFVPGLDLKILEKFKPDEDRVLSPGDMLYLPPGFAHCGTAVGECMTLSIGFRAPSVAELLMAKAQYLAETHQESERYGDPDLKVQKNPAEITPEAIARVKKVLRRMVEDDEGIASFFGQLVTQARREEALTAAQTKKGKIRRRPGSRMAYYREKNRVLLFADGMKFSAPSGALKAIQTLCRETEIERSLIEDAYPVEGFKNLIQELKKQGILAG